MNFWGCELYKKQIRQIAEQLPIKNGHILITGASGLIGSCMIDVLLTANKLFNASFDIYALGRSKEKLENRFSYADNSLHLIEQDITDPLDETVNFDYIVHAASNADPRSYAVYPVETVLTNIWGAKNILDYCKNNIETRAMLTSTFEVYGKHARDEYKEEDFGALDQNSIRSGYPESKRVSEILFRSYSIEYGVDTVIARLSSVYGPTMLNSDSKAHAQFIKNGLSGQNIVLKSEGLQKRTYCYVIDAVSGLFKILFEGTSGEVYNIANSNSIATIAEVAKTVATICKTEVVYDLPDDIEKQGFSKPQNCILDTQKIEKLGWKGQYSLVDGLTSTLSILRESLLL